MRNPKKSFSLGLRIVTFMLGAVFLFWLPIENDRIWMPTMIAFAVSLLWAFWINISRTIRTVKDIVWQMWIGIFSALTVTPMTVLLIFFKSGLHNHDVPDFTPEQILFILQRTPLWAGVGLLIGLGSGIGRIARDPKNI